MFKKTALAAAFGAAALVGVGQAQAADYVVDTEGQHAFVQFKINHLGFSYILGNFESFEGQFHYDPENLEAASVEMEVDVTSLNSNHAERDRHFLSDDFLSDGDFTSATFFSTGFAPTGEGEGTLTGELTLTGQVLPVGGIREKVIAARRSGIFEVILPDANRRDYEELPDHLKEGMTVHFARRYRDVARVVFG